MKSTVNKADWSGILVYVEQKKGNISPVSLELIGEAYRLSEILKQKIYAVVVGENLIDLQKQFKGYPIETVYLYELPGGFKADGYAAAVSKCIREIMPSIVLLGGTNEGRSVAPRLSVEFGSGLTADCTELSIDEFGDLLQTRPAFGGNIMASIVTRETRPQFVTLREKVKQPILPEFKNDILFVHQSAADCISTIQVLSCKKLEEPDSIGDSNLLVVAGRGVQKKEDLAMLRDISALLGGKLACSRALVEKGWMTPREQIGLSGNTVRPNIMITFGVSGTVQFMAGMKQTKNIIAVNSDPNARIFDIAHYPICADLSEVIPSLLVLITENNNC